MWIAVVLACSCAPDPEPAAPLPPPAPAPVVADGVAPAFSAADCVGSELADEVARLGARNGSRVLRTDLDGDGNVDHLELREAEETHSLQVRLSRDARRVRVEWVAPAEARVVHIPVPGELSATERALVEQILFDLRCDRADATLLALVEPQVVHWVAGGPVAPVDYVWVRPTEWVVYRGSELPEPGLNPVGQDGSLVVSQGAWGLLAERDGSHAWLFVDPGPTPVTMVGRLAGDGVVEGIRVGGDASPHPLVRWRP